MAMAMATKYKYLGRKVKDRGRKGLDSAKEFYDIIRAIVSDYKGGNISKGTARGRLLLLYRLSFKKHNQRLSIFRIEHFRKLGRGLKRR